jgi:transposase
MLGGAYEGGRVVHHDAVVQDRREGRTDQAVTAEPGRGPDDVVALPLAPRSAGVDQRRVLAVDRGGGAVRQFRVSVAFIPKMLRRRRLTGRLAAAEHTGGRRGLLDTAALAVMARLIREQNDLTLSALCARVAAERGVRVSVPTMWRAVRRLRLPCKKS